MEQPRGLDPNSMLIWWPAIQGLGIPVPRTVILPTPENDPDLLRKLVFALDDDGTIPPAWGAYAKQIWTAAEEMGYPLFLRTDLFSGKHEWARTCYIPPGESIEQHIISLVIMGECMSLEGFAHRAVVLREFLQLDAPFVAPSYRGMPVAREWRFFVRDGVVQCWHPYWPAEAVQQGRVEDPEWEAKLANLHEFRDGELSLLSTYATWVAWQLGGYWSVDFACTQDGTWYLIDMALGEASWHPECDAAK